MALPAQTMVLLTVICNTVPFGVFVHSSYVRSDFDELLFGVVAS